MTVQKTVVNIDGIKYFVPSNVSAVVQKLVDERKLRRVKMRDLKPSDSFISLNGNIFSDSDDYHMLIIRTLGSNEAYKSILIDSFALPACTIALLQEHFEHIPTLGELALTNPDSIKGVGKKKWQPIENILVHFLD